MTHLTWGIVGAGRIAKQFAQDIQYVSNAKLLAVAARDLKRAQEFADAHAIGTAYGSYAELFNDQTIDAIYIATPHSFHFEQAKAAMLAGKHVLCEKPICVSSDEFSELAAVAKAQGVLLMEAMWTYFLPALRQAKRWVDEGKIGQIKHIKADFGYLAPYEPNSREYDAALAGGSLLDVGIYPLALALFF